MGTWFDASKDGSCSACGAPVSAGDRMLAVRRGHYLCEHCGILKASADPKAGSLESGVIEDLKRFPPEVTSTVLAQSMLYLARQLDHDEVSSRDVPNFSKEMRQALAQLEIMFPPEPEDDTTDRAAKRRERKMAGLDERD